MVSRPANNVPETRLPTRCQIARPEAVSEGTMTIRHLPLLRFLALTVLAVIAAESAAVLLDRLWPTLAPVEPFTHIRLLLVILGPLLYLQAFRPLARQSLRSQESAAALAHSHRNLLTVLDSLDAIV